MNKTNDSRGRMIAAAAIGGLSAQPADAQPGGQSTESGTNTKTAIRKVSMSNIKTAIPRMNFAAAAGTTDMKRLPDWISRRLRDRAQQEAL